MNVRRGSVMLQSLAIVLALPLGPYWASFAFSNFPWIVGPDSDYEIVRAHERAAWAGAGLVLVSIVTMLASAGVFGRGWENRTVAAALLAGLVVATIWLYPPVDLPFSWLRTPAQIYGAVAVVLGVVGVEWRRRSASPRADAAH